MLHDDYMRTYVHTVNTIQVLSVQLQSLYYPYTPVEHHCKTFRADKQIEDGLQ